VDTALTLRLAESESPAPLTAEDFNEVVRLHQKRVYRILLVLTRDPDAAETLTQECFLRAFEKRSSFRGEAQVGTWLVRIAVNLARDHRRSRRAGFWRRLVGLEDEEQNENIAAHLASREPLADRTLAARQQLDAIWAAADKLPARQREVFLLRFAEDMTLAEVAETLGLRVGSVKAHLFRALSAIKKQVKEQGSWRATGI
jgi:RNA polymerase sigma-70 factor (ECF subfamily)